MAGFVAPLRLCLALISIGQAAVCDDALVAAACGAEDAVVGESQFVDGGQKPVHILLLGFFLLSTFALGLVLLAFPTFGALRFGTLGTVTIAWSLRALIYVLPLLAMLDRRCQKDHHGWTDLDNSHEVCVLLVAQR